jgi:SulP family sulfate permease
MTVLIDVSQAHLWDITAVAALHKVVGRFKAHGIATEVLGLNEASATLIESRNGPIKFKAA